MSDFIMGCFAGGFIGVIIMALFSSNAYEKGYVDGFNRHEEMEGWIK